MAPHRNRPVSSITMDPELKRRAQALAALRGTSFSGLLSGLLIAEVERTIRPEGENSPDPEEVRSA